MRLLDLEVFNFMPYKGTQKLAFPTDSSRNVMLVFGSNMRGKTSLLNAVRWCLYGEALDRQHNPIELTKVVNMDAAAEGDWRVSVFATFEANGNTYDLRRVAEPLDLVTLPRRNSDFAVELSLRRNSSVLQGEDIEHEINQIMPAQISRFFLFDAELLSEYEALLIEESEQGRLIKDAIEQVLGVPALINGRNELRTLLKKAQSVLAKENKHIEGMQAQAEQFAKLQAEVEALAKDVSGLRGKEQGLRSNIAELDEILASTEAAQRAQAQLDSLNSQYRQITDRAASLREERGRVLSAAWKDLLQPRLREVQTLLVKERESFQQSFERRGAVTAKIGQIRTLLDKAKCSVCGQEIAPSRRQEFGSQLGTLEAELTALSSNMERVGEISAEITRLSKLHGVGAASALRRVEGELSRTSVDLTRVESEIEKLKRQVAGYDTAEIARHRTKRDLLMQNLGRILEDIRRDEAIIEEKTAKQDQLSRLMSKAPAARTQRSALEVELYSRLERLFASGVDILRERLRERVAERATQAFLKLTTEKSYRQLTINEAYGLTIVDRQGRPVSVRSAGAEQIVALSLIDGLNRTAGKSGPIVMDTPLGRLDPKHRANVLAYIPTMADQVVLLVHEGEISPDEDLGPLTPRIAAMYEIERVSSSESRLVRLKGER